MSKYATGDKVRILPTYCLSKRVGEEYIVDKYTHLYGKAYYSLCGVDWLIQEVDLEPVLPLQV